MARTASKKVRGQIWFPREGVVQHDIKIDGTSVKLDNLGSEFSWGVCPEIGSFKIKLINSDEAYSEKFNLGDTVELFIDFASGTTERWTGEVDRLKNVLDEGMGFTMEISGAHLTRDLININVTESYEGTLTINQILDDLNSIYLTGFTINYTASNTSTPTINWDEKPFWDCVFDLTKLANADARVNADSSIDFFDKNSEENNDEKFIFSQELINIKGLGTQSMTTRNKIKVIGDDGTGLPVLSTSNDEASQAQFKVKELSVFNNKVTNPTYASEIGEAELAKQANPEEEGEVEGFPAPTLKPGQKVWISSPPQKVNGQFRVYKLIHKFPSERTIAVIGNERRLPQVFKKQFETQLASQIITNPNKMSQSINFTFDNFNNLSIWDSNIGISEGKIRLVSGAEGSFTSKIFNQSFNVTEVIILVIGSDLLGTKYQISTEAGEKLEYVTPDSKKTLVTPGDNIVLKVKLNSATTEIDSIAVLMK